MPNTFLFLCNVLKRYHCSCRYSDRSHENISVHIDNFTTEECLFCCTWTTSESDLLFYWMLSNENFHKLLYLLKFVKIVVKDHTFCVVYYFMLIESKLGEDKYEGLYIQELEEENIRVRINNESFVFSF